MNDVTQGTECTNCMQLLAEGRTVYTVQRAGRRSNHQVLRSGGPAPLIPPN
jgi:hypothetical protein